MKKLLFAAIACLALFPACNDDTTEPGPLDISSDQLYQNVYADTELANISFTAAASWETEIVYVETKADAAEPWLTLAPQSGPAGTASIKATLTTNTTESDRKALVKILCDGKTVIVTFLQKATTEDGKIPGKDDPEPEPKPDPINKLVREIRITHNYPHHNTSRLEVYTFTYDDRNRIVKFEDVEYKEGNSSSINWAATYSYSYSGSTITETESRKESNYSYESVITYTLDETGNVKEYKGSDTELNGENSSQSKYGGTLTYDAAGYLQQVTGTFDSDPNSEFCTWKEGNLVKVEDGDNKKYSTQIEYGDAENKYNIDFNYLLAQTEWLGCLAFEGLGIKFFGNIGKRSAKLMTKETDSNYGDYYTYEYKFNKDGILNEITITDPSAGSQVCAISYTDVK